MKMHPNYVFSLFFLFSAILTHFSKAFRRRLLMSVLEDWATKGADGSSSGWLCD
jgi:hypothetical protein